MRTTYVFGLTSSFLVEQLIFLLGHLTLPAVIFALVGLLWTAVELPRLLRLPTSEAAATHDRGSLVVLLAALGIGMFLASLLRVMARGATIGPPAAGVVFGIGIAIILIGIVFRSYAVVVLGRYFMPVVAIQPGQQIVQHGPYRWLRHPSYTGALISVLGVGLVLTNWLSLMVLMLCGVSGLIYRITVEENELIRAFGQQYKDYMRHTWRLIPFIY